MTPLMVGQLRCIWGNSGGSTSKVASRDMGFWRFVIPGLTLGSFPKQRAAGVRGAERGPGGQATGWAGRWHDERRHRAGGRGWETRGQSQRLPDRSVRDSGELSWEELTDGHLQRAEEDLKEERGIKKDRNGQIIKPRHRADVLLLCGGGISLSGAGKRQRSRSADRSSKTRLVSRATWVLEFSGIFIYILDSLFRALSPVSFSFNLLNCIQLEFLV